MTVLVDSDILIEVSRARNTAVVKAWTDLGASEASILFSPLTAAELWAGARTHEFDALTAIFQALTCAPIDYETGEKAGAYLRQYNKSHGLELGDALIASAAWRNNAALWTGNRKHYPMRELSFFS